jgi:hypothetical protein
MEKTEQKQSKKTEEKQREIFWDFGEMRREFNRKRKRRNYVECVKGPMIEEVENMGERKRCVSVRERERKRESV